MAFQETASPENTIEKEWESIEKDTLPINTTTHPSEYHNDSSIIDVSTLDVCNKENYDGLFKEVSNIDNSMVCDLELTYCEGNGSHTISNGGISQLETSEQTKLSENFEEVVNKQDLFINMKLPSKVLTEKGDCTSDMLVESTALLDTDKDKTIGSSLPGQSAEDCSQNEEENGNTSKLQYNMSSDYYSSSQITNNTVDQIYEEDHSELYIDVSSKNSSFNSLISDNTASYCNNLSEEFEKTEHDCLSHPRYTLVSQRMEINEQKNLELERTVKRLRDLLSQEVSKSERILELEQVLSQKEKELSLIKKEQDIDKQSFTLMKKELEDKYALMKKDIEAANRDKENMVMKYAISEKELIDCKKEKEVLFKKMKDIGKENESLLDRMKNLISDKSKLSQLLDSKTTDLNTSLREIEKLKEEINARDIKIKWTQNKLKTEMETHKEYPAQVDKLTNKVKSLEEDLIAAKLESHNLKKKLEESEQNKTLESQLKEEQAKLIMERHEHSEIETKYKSLVLKYQSMIEENNSLSFQVQNLEVERLELDKKLSLSRVESEKLSNIVSELQSKLVELHSLKSQLKQSEDKIENLMDEMERVRHQNEELRHDMSACRARESEMLSFTQKLTTKNVQLQSEFSSLESKAAELEKKDEVNEIELRELGEQLKEVQKELLKERAKREEETRLLARQVAERTKKGDSVEAELADAKANLTQSKHKYATVVKELQRELSQLRRKLDAIEASSPFGSSNSVTEKPYAQACDVPKEVLVGRILKLQAESAKTAEKLEFLEDQNSQLLAKVQKQAHLLQSYMLREEAGALAPTFVDNHKVVKKHLQKNMKASPQRGSVLTPPGDRANSEAEVSKHGGIMASLYSSSQQDDGMSLELSLEINRKLQSVLEDTLLKNIMLKENLDTLGDEIARLTGKE